MKNNLDFLGFLEDYCREHKIYLITGPEAYQNAVADWAVYEAYDLIMCVDLTFNPDFSDELGSVTYNGTIGLGQKREEETESSLDETFGQKYHRRLLKLAETFVAFFNELQCEDEIEMNSCTMSYALNRYDLNADFVVANVSFKING